MFDSPEKKDFTSVRKKFIWIGGAGMAHKGLDLVLEAFKSLPDFSLTVFGKADKDFVEIYKKELFETDNIRFEGHVDLSSKKFMDASSNSLGLIFPSCSEGCSGGVVTSMHAGLIPIISYQSGVDVEDFGVILRENTIQEISSEIRKMSDKNPEELRTMSVKAWEFAREHYTRETFRLSYERVIDELEQNLHKSLISQK